MTTPQTISIDQMAAIGAVWDESFTKFVSNGLGPFTFHLNLMGRSFSVRDPQNLLWDYYYVELEGFASFPGPNIQLSSYVISIFPPSDFELIDSAPATTIGSTSYTSGTSTTVGGSIGFMGEAPMATVDASVTFSSSTTHSISDLTIENKAKMDSPQSALWLFAIASGSAVASSNTQIDVAAIFRRARTDNEPTTPTDFSVCFGAYLVNPDDDGDYMRKWGGDFGTQNPQMIPAFRGPLTQALTGADEGVLSRIEYNMTLSVEPPPPPPAADAT